MIGGGAHLSSRRPSLIVCVLVAASMSGCGGCSDGRATPDSAETIDDAAIDGAGDASIDAGLLPDEDECAGASPACISAPMTFLPLASGTFVTSIKRLDTTLYVANYDSDSGGNVTDARVTVIDLSSGSVTGTLLDGAAVVLSQSSGWIYAVDNEGGEIWRFKPGTAPATLITNRPGPRTAIADADYLYWAESNTNGGVQVMRLAFAGGSPTLVMTSCPQALRLRVDDTHLYCQEFGPNLWSVPKAGGVTATTILNTTYPLVSTIRCGSAIYAASLGASDIFKIPTPSGPGTTLATLTAPIPVPVRITGLAGSANHVYASTEWGIFRISRASGSFEDLAMTTNPEVDSLVYDGKLYYFARDVGVLRCQD